LGSRQVSTKRVVGKKGGGEESVTDSAKKQQGFYWGHRPAGVKSPKPTRRGGSNTEKFLEKSTGEMKKDGHS